MGEDAAGAGKVTRLPGHLHDLTWDRFSAYISKTHEVADGPDLQRLIEELDGYSLRDMHPPSSQFASLAEQRSALWRAASDIKRAAEDALSSIARVRSARERFLNSHGDAMWSATMLREAFAIPHISSTAIEPPEAFDTLRGAFIVNAAEWAQVEADLTKLAHLPVRIALPRGEVRNHGLEQALFACKGFWERSGYKWKRSNLRHKQIRDENRPHLLTDSCERFVVDMLTASGIPFTLTTLNSAWVDMPRHADEMRSTAIDDE
jgi:hypothetical protein